MVIHTALFHFSTLRIVTPVSMLPKDDFRGVIRYLHRRSVMKREKGTNVRAGHMPLPKVFPEKRRNSIKVMHVFFVCGTKGR
jgi:hypothetical protein